MKAFRCLSFAVIASILISFVVFSAFVQWQPEETTKTKPHVRVTEPAGACDRPGLDRNLDFIGNYESWHISLLVYAATRADVDYKVIPGSYCCREGVCSLTGFKGFQIEPGSGEAFWGTVCEYYPGVFHVCD
jgi:hypothetical protein